MWKEVLSRRLDTRLEADTLKLQGELLVFCLYESVDGKTDWICENVPYEGQVECFGAEEGMYHQIYPILTDALLEPAMDEDGEMRLLGIEATLSMRFFFVHGGKDTDIRRFIFTENMLCSSVYAVQGGKCSDAESFQM